MLELKLGCSTCTVGSVCDGCSKLGATVVADSTQEDEIEDAV